MNATYFPKCPFRLLTNYECPGCGSQRALHYLLNFNIAGAFRENPLLVISIPYLLLAFLLSKVANLGKKLIACRRILYGKRAIYFILVIIFSFWILRNVYTGYV